MRALIVGGGIAGPVLGTFLTRLGIEALICEARESAHAGDGAFLGVAPNGMNVLAELGAAGRVSGLGARSNGFTFLNGRGAPLATIDDAADVAKHGFPLTIIRRADLHRVLLDTAVDAGVRVRFGSKLEALDQSHPDRVVARFSDGREEVADFVVGCDGVHSRTRALALPEARAPEYIGMLDFGGYAHAPGAPLPVGFNVMVFGHRAFFGAFKRPDGEILWFHNSGSREPERTRNGIDLHARVLEAHAEDPAWIRDIITRTPEIMGPWPLHDISGQPRWHAGRVCVIGDAAHATSPSAGQGASLAMEDAMMLARCLREDPEPERAFASLVSQRRARVEKIVAAARRNGAPKVVTSPIGRWARDRVLPFFLRLGTKAQREQYDYRIAW